mmetsp:Transcript_55539/g.161309  ORF Transcript_55539/g.161309 Transcript_55539/m.161309 type:complete len:565 (+) Transcript_55539:184-1878(+)
MAIVIVESTMSNIQGNTQEIRPTLRRATYVHVSDLTNVYNIDHAMLEQELKRVKAEREKGTFQEPPKAHDIIEETEDDPVSGSSDLDPSPQKRLQPPRGGYNLCVLVGKVTLVVDKRRVDQSRVRLAEVEIGDETGTVSLRARDEQIDLLEDVSRRSGAVVLRNCTLELYQGKHIRLAVTKWGKLSVYPDNVASTPPAPSKMNFDRNFSAIDLSAVASEMVDIQSDVAYSRQPKQPDTQESGARPAPSKPASQAKHQQSQSSSRRGGRERRQSKGKQGGGALTQPHYLGSSGEHGTVDTHINPMRFTAMHHPYPMYDQSMDLRQYHFTGQQDPVLASGSAQQLMIQRQYELQQHHLHQMYHGQQERLRTGLSPSPHMQTPAMMVPPGSFDTSDYHHPSYSSTGSSPVLVPVPIPGAHLTGNIRLPPTDPQQSTQHDTPSGGQESPSGQLMSISPDDASHMSHGKMNPDATAFSPSYIGPPQATPSGTHQMYFPYNPSLHATPGASYPQPSHPQALYGSGMMYVPAATTDSHPPSSRMELRPKGTSTRPKGRSDNAKGKENVETD